MGALATASIERTNQMKFLGSGHSGTFQWLFQRVSGVTLAVLLGLHFILLHYSGSGTVSYETVAPPAGQPLLQGGAASVSDAGAIPRHERREIRDRRLCAPKQPAHIPHLRHVGAHPGVWHLRSHNDFDLQVPGLGAGRVFPRQATGREKHDPPNAAGRGEMTPSGGFMIA